ncbi:tripartite tricarboxylate transporter permease [Candidatus Pacearchaeota archaeon]|nr:tripartite tricarboxylate transporter permease [Candidatus Pacearchaeota archaeon]
MLLEISLTLLIGILAGTITGLLPGIHINLLAALLISISAFFLGFTSPIILIIFIISMSITHTFVDFIPSVFLGAPDEDTIFSILPGHELLKQGRGYEAVYLATIGSFSAILIILIIAPIFLIILPKIQTLIVIFIPYILIFSSLFLIFQEKNKILGFSVFILSGFLGIAVLNSNIDLREPLLPLLSGLFGASSLIISIKTKVKIPKQIIAKPRLNKNLLFHPILASFASAPLFSFIPAIGSGQAAAIASTIINKKITQEKFLILLGSVNTIILGLSFIIIYSIGKARTGVAAAAQKLIPISNISNSDLFIILITITITGILCFYWTLFLARRFSETIEKINYSKLSIFIILFISLIVFIFSGWIGIFIFIISTAMGIFGILSGARRINLIGCLILPTILIYLL